MKSKESEKRDKYLDFAREMKKTEEHESDGDINCYWFFQYSHQWIGTGTEGLWNKRKAKDHPNNSFVEIGQNTEESPVDLKRLAVTQTPVRNHQLVWEENNNKHKHQQNKNKQITKIGSKATVRTFQATHERNFTRENLDMFKKWKP